VIIFDRVTFNYAGAADNLIRDDVVLTLKIRATKV